MKTDLELFAAKLKKIRQKRKLTLEMLAEKSDLTPNHIAKLEAAKTNPSFNSISRIAKALNVEIKELFSYDEFKDSDFIIKEFRQLLKHPDKNLLQLLYKIYKNVLN